GEHADSHAARRTPGELTGAEDPGENGGGAVRVGAHLGRAPDAPAVNQPFSGAAVVDRGTVHVEAKDPRALDEERPLLPEKRLERREVEHRRIGLDLAEVRIDRGVEREVRGDAVLQAATDGDVLRAAEPGRTVLRHVL